MSRNRSLMHKNFSLYVAMFLLFTMNAASAQQPGYSSPCGGSARDQCDCTDRYECDQNGSCSCVGDQYCADTNCPNEDAQSKAALSARVRRLIRYLKNAEKKANINKNVPAHPENNAPAKPQ